MIITYLAPAKLNLFLHILGLRADGYHWLESLVIFLDLADKLTYQPADKWELTITGRFSQGLSPQDPSNLVLRAAQLLADHAGHLLQGHIHLEKNIPVAAGLGGGSSDAAATLLMLNDVWHLNVSFDDLCQLAKQLGADVQACLWRQPLLMRGIGDQIELYNEKLPDFSILLVNPLQNLATIKVYQHYDTLNQPESLAEPPIGPMLPLVEGRNDLTSAAIDLCPIIQTLLQKLQSQEGCQLARMAGSGATCFGIFASEDLCQAAYEKLQKYYPEYWWHVAKMKPST